MSSNYLYRVLERLVEDLNRDFIETQRDKYIALRREAFYSYYDVKPLTPLQKDVRVGFVDAGFTVYEFDVSIIVPLRIGAVIREPDGSLHRVNEYLDTSVYDALLLYSSRRAVEDRYMFRVKIDSFHENGLLFSSSSEAHRVSSLINQLLVGIGGFEKTRSPHFFKKLTKYLEGLLELVYALKLFQLFSKAGYPLDYVVLDGSLIKWFSIKRSPGRIDGLNILSIILGVDENVVVERYLPYVIGLSKTTKFTNIIRSQSLFNVKKPRDGGVNGLYSLIDLRGLERLREGFENILRKVGREKFVDETLNIFNRTVFHRHGVWVSRFPVTPDNQNIFMIDAYLNKPIIYREGLNVVIDRDNASNTNSRIDYVAKTLFLYRTSSLGEPPYGYMEVDKDVRFNRDIRRVFEDTLLTILRERSDVVSRILEQAFLPTTRMRYGYK